MYIQKNEIARIIKEESKKPGDVLTMEDNVESIRVFFNMQKRYYIISASINQSGYENRSILKVDEEGKIVDFSCSCPYCLKESGCRHVEMIARYFSDHEIIDGYSYYNDVEKVKAQKQQQLQLRKEKELIDQRMDDTHMFIDHFKNNYVSEMYDHLTSENYHLISHITFQKQRDGLTQTYVFHIDYKLGNSRLYVIKKISEFIDHLENNDQVKYGKNLEFIHTINAFDDYSQSVIGFMEQMNQVYLKDNYLPLAKFLPVSQDYFDDFYDVYSTLPAGFCNLAFTSRDYQINLKLTKSDDYYILSLKEFFEEKDIILSSKHLYMFEDEILTRLKLDEKGQCMALLKKLNEADMLISLKDFPALYKYVLSDCEPYLNIDSSVHLGLDEEESISLYGDVDDYGEVFFELQYYYSDYMCYGFDQDNSNISKTADMIEAYISHFVSEIRDHKIYMEEEEKLYAFLKDGLPYLSAYCQIFVSDALKQVNNAKRTSITVGVSIQNNLLEIELDSLDLDKDEIMKVLSSYRKKRKFHRLKNGKLLYLSAPQFEELDHLTQSLHLKESDFKDGKARLPMYRVFEYDAFSKNEDVLDYHQSHTIDQFIKNFDTRAQQFDLPKHYETILRDYQKEGYQWLKLIASYGFGGILADDMGLGKTVQMLSFLESEKQQDRQSIVICPASLILNWENEVHKFCDKLSCLPIYGSKAQRNHLIEKIDDYDLIITSYDYLRRDIDLLEDVEFFTIVLDEAQYIKNQKTQNARCVKRLKGEHRFALTGTPIENSLAELWSIFDFLMPNYLYNYHYFTTHFERPIVKDNDEDKRQRLQSMTSPFLLRRKKEVVLKELPPKIENTLTFTFNEREKNLYYGNLMQVNEELAQHYDVDQLGKFDILPMITRLRQICLDARLVYDDIDEPSSKIKGCVELLHSLIDNHKKVLLFSSFPSVLKLLAVSLKEEHISYYFLDGHNSKEERSKMVNQFQNDATNVFLISLKAGGTGINLTAAEAVIHFDPWWNVSAQNQATDRAYRIGQDKAVQVFNLIMKDTIEERIQDLQKQKKDLADAFVEDGSLSLENMSKEEIMSLFK